MCNHVQHQQQPQAAGNITEVTLNNNKAYSFDLASRLGQGAQGSVFKAKATDGSLIALKIVEKKSGRDDREYANLDKIKHTNVVEVLGHGTILQNGSEYLAIGMGLVAGESYDEYLKSNGKIDWQKAAEDFRQLIAGTQAVHEQVLTYTRNTTDLLLRNSTLYMYRAMPRDRTLSLIVMFLLF